MGEEGSVNVEKCGFDHGTDSCENGTLIISPNLDNFNHVPTDAGVVFVKISTAVQKFYLQVNKSLV
jgi:hypothetical protein